MRKKIKEEVGEEIGEDVLNLKSTIQILENKLKEENSKYNLLKLEMDAKEIECMEMKAEVEAWKGKYEELHACSHQMFDESPQSNMLQIQRYDPDVVFSPKPKRVRVAEIQDVATTSQKIADDGVPFTSQRSSTGKFPSKRRYQAVRRAEELLRKLNSGNPHFLKEMSLSHVHNAFFLCLPKDFCEKYLAGDSNGTANEKKEMVLEDEEGSDYNVTYIVPRMTISAGWRRFTLDHDLVVGDILAFELTDQTRFKVYIVKAEAASNDDADP